MANHDLKDEIAMLQQKPWSSLAICERVISILDFSFSLRTKFFWKAERDSADTKNYIDERNLPGSLFSLQLRQLKDGSTVFCCKPLSGVRVMDLIGQARVSAKTHIFLTEDNKILVNLDEKRVLMFDDEGYITHKTDQTLSHFKRIVLESKISNEFGKSFLV